MGSNYTKIFYRDYEKLQKEHERILEKQKSQEGEIRRFQLNIMSGGKYELIHQISAKKFLIILSM